MCYCRKMEIEDNKIKRQLWKIANKEDLKD
jgi:hypothetical protein